MVRFYFLFDIFNNSDVKMGYTIIIVILLTSQSFNALQIIEECVKEKNYYRSSTHPPTCLPCKVCSKGQYVSKPCTSYRDTVCKKCPGNSFSNIPNSMMCSKCPKNTYFKDGICQNCTICKPGQYAYKLCSKTEDTECKDCLLGSYNPKENVAEYCKPCRMCRRNVVNIHRCNKTSDSVCGDCKPGYYLYENTMECRKCSYCYPKFPGYTIQVNACLKTMHDPNYSCMEVMAPPPVHPSYEQASTILPDTHDSIGESDNVIFLLPLLIVYSVLMVLICFLLFFLYLLNKGKTNYSRVKMTTENTNIKKKPSCRNPFSAKKFDMVDVELTIV